MKICGLQKTTLLDYPGHVAATIFLGGCNFKCPFCHNMNIVNNSADTISQEYIISFLKKRQGVLDGVCITGGEPTLYKDLPAFLLKIKELEYKVKLDTNGTNPEMIMNLHKDGLIDYVAMDIKSGLSEYARVTGIEKAFSDEKIGEILNNIQQSVSYILNCGIEYEFRTTIVDEYHTADSMREIGKLINGAEKYYLQSFRDSEFVPDHNLSSPEKEKLLVLLSEISDYVKNAEIRGVD